MVDPDQIRAVIRTFRDGLLTEISPGRTEVPKTLIFAKNEKSLIFKQGYGKNTGLGMFLIKEVLEIIGMTIKETGEPGKGARFEIEIPAGKFRGV